MRIAHISDSHISVDHPHRTADLQASVDVINAEPTRPDAVIHTGDIAHNGTAEEYNTAKRILDTLNMPYFVLTGNRDKRAELIEAFADNQAIHTSDQFVQYAVEQFPVRLIVLDTLSSDSNKGELCAARLEHLQSMLEADQQKPAAIFMHHTPFEVGAIPDPFQFDDWATVKRLSNLLGQYPQVTGIYCGHIHRNIDGMLGKLNVSAISCMATDLRKGELTDEERTKPIVNIHTLADNN